MKTFFFLVLFGASFWMVDLVVLDGANSQRIAWEAKREARLANQYVEHWLRKLD